MHAENLVKVTGTGEVKGKKRPSTLRKLHIVLIMRIINVIINRDDIRMERSGEGPTLKLNEKFK